MIIFDTDVLSALMATRQPPATTLTDRIAETDADDHATTTITLGEIAYGAFRVGRPELYERARELITAGGLTVLAFDQPAAEHYGAIRTALEREGRRLADPDLRIAAMARSRGALLVTRNVRHFARVPELRSENWIDG